MSDFAQLTKHPITGRTELAHWIDDHFGRRRYGVKFSDGQVFRETEIEAIEVNGVSAESNGDQTAVKHWDGSVQTRDSGAPSQPDADRHAD